MTRHIDHAPQYPNNPNNRRYHQGSDGRLQDTQNPVHSERFADPYGGSAPAHPDGPRGELKRPKDSKTVLKVVGAIGAASLAAGAAFGIYNYNKLKDLTDDIKDGADRTVSAPYNPGETDGSIDYSKIDIATYPSAEFAMLPTSVKIDKCAPYIDQKITDGAAEKYDLAVRAANPNAYTLEPGGIGTGSINDQPQQLVNRHYVKLDIIRTETNLNLAKNALWCISSTAAMYNAYEDSLINSRTGRPVLSGVGNEAAVIPPTSSFANTEANGRPTKVVVGIDRKDKKVVDFVFQEEKGDKSSEVLTSEILTSNSPYWINSVSELNP